MDKIYFLFFENVLIPKLIADDISTTSPSVIGIPGSPPGSGAPIGTIICRRLIGNINVFIKKMYNPIVNLIVE